MRRAPSRSAASTSASSPLSGTCGKAPASPASGVGGAAADRQLSAVTTPPRESNAVSRGLASPAATASSKASGSPMSGSVSQNASPASVGSKPGTPMVGAQKSGVAGATAASTSGRVTSALATGAKSSAPRSSASALVPRSASQAAPGSQRPITAAGSLVGSATSAALSRAAARTATSSSQVLGSPSTCISRHASHNPPAPKLATPATLNGTSSRPASTSAVATAGAAAGTATQSGSPAPNAPRQVSQLPASSKTASPASAPPDHPTALPVASRAPLSIVPMSPLSNEQVHQQQQQLSTPGEGTPQAVGSTLGVPLPALNFDSLNSSNNQGGLQRAQTFAAGRSGNAHCAARRDDLRTDHFLAETGVLNSEVDRRGPVTPRSGSPWSLRVSAGAAAAVAEAGRPATTPTAETDGKTTPQRLFASSPRTSAGPTSSPGSIAAALRRISLSQTGVDAQRPVASTPRMRAAQLRTDTRLPMTAAAAAGGGSFAADAQATQDLFAAASSKCYIDGVAESMTALYVPCLSPQDISRLPYLADVPPAHVCLRSLPITTNVVANMLSYCNHHEIHDLMFDHCVFTLFDYTWFKRITGLKTIRLRGSTVDTRIITQVLTHATQVQNVTLLDCAPVIALPALTAKTSRIQSLQLINTHFTQEALADIVNGPTVREVMLLNVGLRTNIFELFNSSHIDTVHLVGCPDLYYEPKPESEWLSNCSPRAGGGGSVPIRSLLVTDCESLSLETLPWGDMGGLQELSIMHREQQALPISCLHDVFHASALKLLRLQHVFIDEYLVRQLQLCGRLEELNLSYCKGFVGMNEVWRALSELRRLNLSHSEISSEQLAGLQVCARLEQVFAQHCPYVQDFSVFRALPALQLIDLTGCTALGCDGFAGDYACMDLRAIILNGCTRLRDITGLGSVSSLEVVRLRGCHVREESVATVLAASIGRLSELDLSETDNVYDLSAVPFQLAEALVRVNLSYSDVVDSTVTALGQCPHLCEADLSGCENITSVADLSAVGRLRVLDLSFSAIESDGLAAYAEEPGAKYLEFLRLRGCTGVVDLSCLGKLKRLIELDLSASSVDAVTSLPAIAAGCTSLTALSLQECSNVHDLSALGDSRTVHKVNASLTAITDDCLVGLAKCQSIEELELSGCEGLRNVSPLSALRLLQRLNLSNTSVDVSSMAGFGSCPLLWDLSLAKGKEVRDISILSTITSLQRLDVSGTGVDDRSFAVPWRTALLEDLDLSGCTALSQITVGIFRGLTGLRCVSLSRTAVDDTAIAAVASCLTLEEIVLDDCANVRSLAGISSMRSLRTLRAAGTPADDASVADLAKCVRLAHVDLSRSPNVHDLSALGLLQGLRTLRLAGSGASDATFPAAKHSPWRDSPLEMLDLSGCVQVRQLPGIASLARRLLTLDLAGSGVTDAGLAHVAELKSLRVLRLANCQSIDSAAALRAMPALKLLDMSSSSVARLVDTEGEMPLTTTAATTHVTKTKVSGANELSTLWCTPCLIRVSFARCQQLLDVSALHELPALTLLDLSSSACANESFAHVSWAKCVALQELRLRDCAKIGSLRGLRAMPRLVTLDLAGSSASSEAIGDLSDCPSLEVVDVSRCAQLETVQCFSALPRLRRLCMRGSGVTSLSFAEPWTCRCLLEIDARDCTMLQGLPGISSLPALRRITLANSSVTDAGLRAIAKIATIEDIDLAGCKGVRSATALSKLTALRRVDLSGSLVDNTTLIALPMCPAIEELNLLNCEKITDAFLAHNFGRLRVLRVPPLDRIVGTFIRHCPYLEVLSLQQCPDTPRATSWFASLPFLKALDLSGSHLSREVVESLEKCALLEELDLSGCANLEFLSALSNLPCFKRLSVARTAVGNEVCEALIGCPGLQAVNLSYCANISNVTALTALKRLRFLDVSGTAVSDGVFAAARQLPSLEELVVRECANIKDASALAGAPRLRRIDAANSSLMVLNEAELRTRCPLLKEINLTGCSVRRQGGMLGAASTMFANLGIESEHKEANKRQTGRRHAPREMTSDNGVPVYYTSEAATNRRASDQYREQQVRNANAGPSFMDQIFDGDCKRGAAAASQHPPHGSGVNRPATTPKDQLNLFSWESNGVPGARRAGGNGGGRGGGSGAGPAAAGIAPPPPPADDLRGAEARKFERNTHSNFLAFSEVKKATQGGSLCQGKGTAARQPQPAPFATDMGYGNETHDGAARKGRRAPPAPRGGDGKAVQGFKGMGEQCSARPTGRRAGKQEPSQVFPPSCGGEQPIPPQQKSQQQRSRVPERPAWLAYDDASEEQQQRQEQQRSVKFDVQSSNGPDNVYDDERYYEAREGGADAYLDDEMYWQEQQQPQHCRVMQYQRRGEGDDPRA